MDKTQAALVASSAVIAANVVGGYAGVRRLRNVVWYASLRKPDLTPPPPVIGAVWTVLDVLMAVAGTRLLTAPPNRTRDTALGCWSLSVAGIAAYPWVFFDRKKLGASTAASSAMLASATAYVATAARVDRPAAAMGVPLIVWLGLATLLSEELWRRNR